MADDEFTFDEVRDGSDLDAVAALEAESFTNPWTREMLERELRQCAVARVYVLRAPDSTIVAFCSCWLFHDELHINTIAVTPAVRRRGLATQLMAHVFDAARAAGAVQATLEVRESNAAARRLYERLGFRIGGIRRQYYSHPVEDALILWRHDLSRMP